MPGKLFAKIGVAAALALPLVQESRGGVDFKSEVLPVLEAKCFSCHQAPHEKDGKLVKPKAGLRLDAPWAMQQGGASGHPAVVAKGVAKSYLLEVVTLPQDDDMFMPPKGEPMSKEEVARVKAWIEAGADFGGWEGNPAGKAATASTPAAKEREHEALYKRLGEGLGPVAPEEIQRLKEQAGAQVMALTPGGGLVRVDFLTGVSACKDESVAALLGIRQHIAHLDLSRTAITDAVFGTLDQMPRLTRLDLRRTAVTDTGVKDLASCENLSSLNLYGTAVTDAVVPALAALKSLRQVYLHETKVSAAGLATLRGSRPDLEVVSGLDLPMAGKKGANAETMERRKKKKKDL